MDRAEIIAAIESMTVLELAELVKELEEKFGVSAAAPVAVAAAPAAAAAAEPAEEKTEFDVILKEVGADKIKVIKVVRLSLIHICLFCILNIISSTRARLGIWTSQRRAAQQKRKQSQHRRDKKPSLHFNTSP